MVAGDEIQRDAQQIDVAALVEILLRGGGTIDAFLGHERVAKDNVESWPIRGGVAQRALIPREIGVVVEVRVGCDGEGERTFTPSHAGCK